MDPTIVAADPFSERDGSCVQAQAIRTARGDLEQATAPGAHGASLGRLPDGQPPQGNLRRCATTYPTAGSQDGRRVIVQGPSAGRLEAERDAPQANAARSSLASSRGR